MKTTPLHALALSIALQWAGTVQAQNSSDDADPLKETADRHMACLQAAPPTTLEASTAGEGTEQLLRARLIFSAGQVEPSVEWLWKASELAAAQLEPHLRRYRMPCLQDGEAPKAVVQEFWLKPATGRLESGAIWRTRWGAPDSAGCYRRPNTPLDGSRLPDGSAHALVFFRFPGDSEEPEVRVAHYTGSETFAEAVRKQVRRYRRCSNGGTPSNSWHEQLFKLNGGAAKAKPLSLAEFLGFAEGVEGSRAHFDFGSMGCPFQVSWTLWQPARRNTAWSAEADSANDAQRHVFLSWLGGLQLRLSSRIESAMFGEVFKIGVPCGVLDLRQPAAG
ncbi:hypothetical protein [Roseateles violae]|uniref:Uncharacterized protein n=1 Tax=Roseateles violae TaxID=3058042 RepID=A0ABT8DRL3_9BURK|nr:hypothetical protein [Pelomonas sp. PFR6]MDN3918766.1 hypothetical protein [Pelomonas sp. PFR6]